MVNGIGWTVYMSASRSLVQELLPKEDLLNGNSLIEISLQVGMFVAGGVSGVLYKFYGFEVILILNAGCICDQLAVLIQNSIYAGRCGKKQKGVLLYQFQGRVELFKRTAGGFPAGCGFRCSNGFCDGLQRGSSRLCERPCEWGFRSFRVIRYVLRDRRASVRLRGGFPGKKTFEHQSDRAVFIMAVSIQIAWVFNHYVLVLYVGAYYSA